MGDLTARHIGARLMIIDGNTVVDGTLDSFWVDTTFKGETKLNVLRVKTDAGQFELKNIPVDYVVQVVSTDAEEGHDGRE